MYSVAFLCLQHIQPDFLQVGTQTAHELDLLECFAKALSEDDFHKIPRQPMALDPLHTTPTTSVFCSMLPPKPLQVAATWLDRIHSLLPKRCCIVLAPPPYHPYPRSE